MTKKNSFITGACLVLLVGLALVTNLVLPALGLKVPWWQVWRLWPVLILAIGLLINALPFLLRTRPGLGALFIPGVPILVTGGILLFCSLFDAWGAWSFFWPLEPLALGLGFAFATLWLRSAGLAFPAILIGMNALVLVFCNITGWWQAWALLWTIEPLALGLALLLLGVRRDNRTLVAVGLGFCGFSALAAVFMGILLLIGGWILRLFWPLILIFAGLAFLFLGILNRSQNRVNPPLDLDSETLPQGSQT